MAAIAKRQVLTVADVVLDDLIFLLGKYGLELVVEDDSGPITGTFWGEPEAGIVKRTIYVHRDTPIHSLLHESCHVICMTANRREALDRDAGGDDLEEAAVCYLQILLADHIHGVGRDRIMLDMDTWGYSFRLGSSREWFYHDAGEAKTFLINHGLLTVTGKPVYTLRR